MAIQTELIVTHLGFGFRLLGLAVGVLPLARQDNFRFSLVSVEAVLGWNKNLFSSAEFQSITKVGTGPRSAVFFKILKKNR